MDGFELNHAVSLFTEQTTTITNLWTVYAVATFAAAGFTASPLSRPIAAAVTIGFLAFAIGHWHLLKQGLQINVQLASDISKFIQSHPGNSFEPSINNLISTANPPWISLAIHPLIDACVVVALWARVKRTAS